MNSGGSGPPPRYVVEAMRAADDLLSGPAYLEGSAFYAHCAEANANAREAAARLLGAAPEDLALTQNTSHGMSLGVAAMDWREGDEVISTTTEHPGCLVPLHALEKRYGVKIKLVSPSVSVEKIKAEISERTRLIALSHVDWTTGEILPLEEISTLARERNVLTLVDGAQSVGNMATDIPATGVDMYAFTGHKWLLGPEGIGGFYVSPDCRVSSANLGFLSLADPYSFNVEGDYELKSGAGRFEASTMSPALAGGFAAAAGETHNRGEEGFAEIRRKADLLMELLSENPKTTLRTPRPAKNGLVSFEIEGVPAKEATEKLLEKRFVVRFLPEPTHYVRASTHLFNSDEEIEALAKEVAAL
ncbi:MAG: aminotransferase class V-fold PLP-dependent enzyme [Rubrobacteraceae bacterium]|nr:aminotransferase class V-fold PLP-dependent enzyme [Rubrobacter sp.]